MIFTNIPWTQAVLALCALIATILTLCTLLWKALSASMKNEIHEIKTNHLAHVEDKVDMVLDYLKIPHVKRKRE